jgi:nitroreductase
MNDDDVYQAAVGAIELATRAPSIHNSQPWRCSVDRSTVHLYAAVDRWLPATDGDRRDLMLSCGAMLHHLVVALRATGLRPTVHRMPNPAFEDHLAAIDVESVEPADDDIALARVLGERRTDRRPYSSWPVPDPFLAQLSERASERGAILRVVTDPATHNSLLTAIGQAAAIQRTQPGYETELALWTRSVVSDDGVPAANLLQTTSRQADASRDFPQGGDLPSGGSEPDGAILLVLGTASDDPLSRLRAGEAMSAVMLRATQLGLATCPLSQPIEVAAARSLVHDSVLGGTLAPQLILRAGFPPTREPLPPTPRRPVREVLQPRLVEE